MDRAVVRPVLRGVQGEFQNARGSGCRSGPKARVGHAAGVERARDCPFGWERADLPRVPRDDGSRASLRVLQNPRSLRPDLPGLPGLRLRYVLRLLLPAEGRRDAGPPRALPARHELRPPGELLQVPVCLAHPRGTLEPVCESAVAAGRDREEGDHPLRRQRSPSGSHLFRRKGARVHLRPPPPPVPDPGDVGEGRDPTRDVPPRRRARCRFWLEPLLVLPDREGCDEGPGKETVQEAKAGMIHNLTIEHTCALQLPINFLCVCLAIRPAHGVPQCQVTALVMV